jgi:hypothetical protein
MINNTSNFDDEAGVTSPQKMLKTSFNNSKDIEMIKARNALLSDKDDDISESLSSSSENSSSK